MTDLPAPGPPDQAYATWTDDKNTWHRISEVAGEVHGRCASYLASKGLDDEVAMAAAGAWSELGACHAGLTPGMPTVDSPIEAMFIQAMQYYKLTDRIIVRAQVEIGPYRVDFLVFALGDPHGVIVECDGHDFHERTREQSEHDKKRDRFLTSEGYRVLRFTGREIWRDPLACAREVAEARKQEFMRVGGGVF